MKNITKLISICALSFAVAGCSLATPPQAVDQPKGDAAEGATFTLEELATYNGTNGNPAYIAVDGTVYDVSAYFADGIHNGFEAGKDYTVEFKNQHGQEKLDLVSPVGTLAAQASVDGQTAPAEKTFTTADLATYNGKNGNKAYIAVSGVVYDVTNYFTEGNHNGFEAGKDQTAAFQNEHSAEKLSLVSAVGVLDGVTSATPSAKEATPTTSDLITREDAIEIALTHAKVSVTEIRDLEVDIDTEHDKTYYEVDFDMGQTEYKYDIDAKTGEIMKSETEPK